MKGTSFWICIASLCVVFAGCTKEKPRLYISFFPKIDNVWRSKDFKDYFIDKYDLKVRKDRNHRKYKVEVSIEAVGKARKGFNLTTGIFHLSSDFEAIMKLGSYGDHKEKKDIKARIADTTISFRPYSKGFYKVSFKTLMKNPRIWKEGVDIPLTFTYSESLKDTKLRFRLKCKNIPKSWTYVTSKQKFVDGEKEPMIELTLSGQPTTSVVWNGKKIGLPNGKATVKVSIAELFKAKQFQESKRVRVDFSKKKLSFMYNAINGKSYPDSVSLYYKTTLYKLLKKKMSGGLSKPINASKTSKANRFLLLLDSRFRSYTTIASNRSPMAWSQFAGWVDTKDIPGKSKRCGPYSSGRRYRRVSVYYKQLRLFSAAGTLLKETTLKNAPCPFMIGGVFGSTAKVASKAVKRWAKRALKTIP